MSGTRYLFTSDVHLSPHAGEKRMQTFRNFLAEKAEDADALYILGDLFDYWTGGAMLREDGLLPLFDSMKALSAAGTAIILLPGNRDFLVRSGEAGRMGAELAPGETLEVELGGLRIFLTHGDIFCTFDKAYQRMKRVLRNPVTLGMIRAIPDSLRNSMARRLRSHSSHVKRQKTEKETSLDLDSVQGVISKGFNAVICGHVHRFGDEELAGGGRLLTLSDWQEDSGSYAELTDEGLVLKSFGGP